MKLVHKDTRLVVIAIIGSLIFHALVLFAIDFRLVTPDQEQKILNVQLFPQPTLSDAVSDTVKQEQNTYTEVLNPAELTLAPEPVSVPDSSHQEINTAQLERDTTVSAENSPESDLPNLEVSNTPTELVNVLEPSSTSNDEPQVSIQDLLKTATAIVREQSSESTVRNIAGDEASNIEEEYYLKAWLKRVQEIGQLNYPREAIENKIYGKLRLYVSIKPDGSVKETRVVRSSGHEVLDEAAKKIVELASPFSAFPPSMRESLDLLEIVREWEFRKEALVPSDEIDEEREE